MHLRRQGFFRVAGSFSGAAASQAATPQSRNATGRLPLMPTPADRWKGASSSLRRAPVAAVGTEEIELFDDSQFAKF